MSFYEAKLAAIQDNEIVSLVGAADAFFRRLVRLTSVLNEVSLHGQPITFRLYSEQASRWNYEHTQHLPVTNYLAYWSLPLAIDLETVREDYHSYYTGCLQGAMVLLLNFTEQRETRIFDLGKRVDLIVAGFNEEFEDRRNQRNLMSHTQHLTVDDFSVSPQRLHPHFVARVGAYIIRAQQQAARMQEIVQHYERFST